MKRTYLYTIRLSAKEMKNLRANAKKYGLTMASYLRLSCGLLR